MVTAHLGMSESFSLLGFRFCFRDTALPFAGAMPSGFWAEASS
jgi:hypothetical protein